MATPKPEFPLTRDLITKAIINASGNVSVAAGRLGVSRSKIQKEIDKSPALQQLVTDQTESLVDLAETSIKNLCLKGEPGSVKFVLETQGRARGWGRHKELEITGADGGAISFKSQVISRLAKQADAILQGGAPQEPDGD
jgi:hypothetical protein